MFSLLENRIDVWYLDKNALLFLHDWESMLSNEEKKRADKFHFSHDQKAFTLYHACKRIILSNYLNIHPNEVKIQLNNNGKPFVTDNPIFFNLSHTKEMAVLATALATNIGIDLERVKSNNNLLSIAKRFFHPKEHQQLLEYNNIREQEIYFYRLWTAKEALLKATGKGLSGGLDAFYVDANDQKNGTIAHSYLPMITLTELECPEGFVGSLAIIGPKKSVQYFNVIQLLNLGNMRI